MIERLEYGKFCKSLDGDILPQADYRFLAKTEGFPRNRDLDQWQPKLLFNQQYQEEHEKRGGSVFCAYLIYDVEKEMTSLCHVMSRSRFRYESSDESNAVKRMIHFTRVLADQLTEDQGLGLADTYSPLEFYLAHMQEPIKGLTKEAAGSITKPDLTDLSEVYAEQQGRQDLSQYKELVNHILSGTSVALISSTGEPLDERDFYVCADALWSLLPDFIRPYFSAIWNGDSIKLDYEGILDHELYTSSSACMLSSPISLDPMSAIYTYQEGTLTPYTGLINREAYVFPHVRFEYYDHAGELSQNEAQERTGDVNATLRLKNSLKIMLQSKAEPTPILFKAQLDLPQSERFSPHLFCNEMLAWRYFSKALEILYAFVESGENQIHKALDLISDHKIRLLLLTSVFQRFAGSEDQSGVIEARLFKVYQALELPFLNTNSFIIQDELKNLPLLHVFDRLRHCDSEIAVHQRAWLIFETIKGVIDRNPEMKTNPELNEYFNALQRPLNDIQKLVVKITAEGIDRLTFWDHAIDYCIDLDEAEHPLIAGWFTSNIDLCFLSRMEEVFREQDLTLKDERKIELSPIEGKLLKLYLGKYRTQLIEHRDSLDHQQINKIERFFNKMIEDSLEGYLPDLISYFQEVDSQYLSKVGLFLRNQTLNETMDQREIVVWLCKRPSVYTELDHPLREALDQYMCAHIGLLTRQVLSKPQSQQEFKEHLLRLSPLLANLLNLTEADQSISLDDESSRLHFTTEEWRDLVRWLISSLSKDDVNRRKERILKLSILLSNNNNLEPSIDFLRIVLNKAINVDDTLSFDSLVSGDPIKTMRLQPFEQDEHGTFKHPLLQDFNEGRFIGLNPYDCYQILALLSEQIDELKPAFDAYQNEWVCFVKNVNKSEVPSFDKNSLAVVYYLTWLLTFYYLKGEGRVLLNLKSEVRNEIGWEFSTRMTVYSAILSPLKSAYAVFLKTLNRSDIEIKKYEKIDSALRRKSHNNSYAKKIEERIHYSEFLSIPRYAASENNESIHKKETYIYSLQAIKDSLHDLEYLPMISQENDPSLTLEDFFITRYPIEGDAINILSEKKVLGLFKKKKGLERKREALNLYFYEKRKDLDRIRQQGEQLMVLQGSDRLCLLLHEKDTYTLCFPLKNKHQALELLREILSVLKEKVRSPSNIA